MAITKSGSIKNVGIKKKQTAPALNQTLKKGTSNPGAKYAQMNVPEGAKTYADRMKELKSIKDPVQTSITRTPIRRTPAATQPTNNSITATKIQDRVSAAAEAGRQQAQRAAAEAARKYSGQRNAAQSAAAEAARKRRGK